MHVKEATSMQQMAGEVIEEAKKCTINNVPIALTCITLDIDFMQNMDLPCFGCNQPG